MSNLNSLLGNNVSSDVVNTLPKSNKMEEVLKHLKAGELVICLESNIGASGPNTIFSTVGGGIYTYKANPGSAFMTTCPMGYSLATKGDYSSAKTYYDRGEFTRLVLDGSIDEDAPSLEDLQNDLKDAKALLAKATSKTKSKIEMMILNLEQQIEDAQTTSGFKSEVMNLDDWTLICKKLGLETGEIKLFFPLKFNADEIMDIRRDRSIKGVKVYFLLSNVSKQVAEIYPRRSSKEDTNTLISVNADGVERHGINVTVTPIHVEFFEERFSHAKQLFMLDPTGFNAAAKAFADRDNGVKTVEFLSLDKTVKAVNIRAKKLPQAQAMMEKYLSEGVWLSDVEHQLEAIANSKQFFSFGPNDFDSYITTLKAKYSNYIVNDVVVSESELKKGKLTASVSTISESVADVQTEIKPESISNPLDTDDEVNLILAGE